MALSALVSARIRQARRELDLTQAEAAERLGISQNAWATYEAGNRSIGIETLERIAEILEKPIAYFVVEDYEYTIKASLPKAESPGARAKRKRAA